MANVVLKLDLSPNNETTIGNKNINLPVNNTSKAITEPLEKNDGYNCIIMGRYAQTKNGKLINQYNGIQGDITRGFEGEAYLSTPLTLTIVGANNGLIDNVTIYFDKIANQFATECTIDGKTLYSDDPIWTIKFDTPKNTQTIQFDTWNRPDYHWCITYIGVELHNVELDKHSIKSISNFQQIRPSQPEPFFSAITGNGEFKIKNSEFLDYANDNVLESGAIVDIYINDMKYNTMLIENWDSDFIDKTITANTADINKLLDTQFKGMFYEPQLLYKVPLYKLLGYILETGNIKYSFPKAPSSTPSAPPYNLRERFYNIYFDLPFLQASTYREIINKLCLIGEMICIVNVEENRLEFIDGRPRLKKDGSEIIIEITANAQEKDFTQNLIPNNNYTSIQYEYTDRIINAKIIVYSGKKSIENDNNIPDGINTIKSVNYKGSEKIYYKDYGECTLEYNIHCVDYQYFIENINNYNLNNLVVLCDYDYGTSANSNAKMQFKVNNQEFDIDNLLKDFINQTPYTSIYDRNIVQYYTLINRNISYTQLENTRYFRIVIPYSIEIYIKSKDNEEIAELIQQKSSIKFSLSFNEISLQTNTKTETMTSEDNKKGNLLVLNSNEFFANNVYYYKNSNKIAYYDVIIDNILKDYSTKKGIKLASLTIRSGVDFYGNQILHTGNLGNRQKYVFWSGIDNTYNKPNTIRIGDIVKILDVNGKSKSKYPNGTDRLWKVISCEFIYEYVPKWKLELMEIW